MRLVQANANDRSVGRLIDYDGDLPQMETVTAQVPLSDWQVHAVCRVARVDQSPPGAHHHNGISCSGIMTTTEHAYGIAMY